MRVVVSMVMGAMRVRMRVVMAMIVSAVRVRMVMAVVMSRMMPLLLLGAVLGPVPMPVPMIVPMAAEQTTQKAHQPVALSVSVAMIVVMAAGNTPLMSWNIFDGLRALSANIAVELPEAVKDSTLYRMLFLAAFVLFVMTFVINTFAEIVRLRFRRRSAQL